MAAAVCDDIDSLRGRAGGGAGRLPRRRRGPRRPHPFPARRLGRARRAGHDRPGLDEPSGTTGRGTGCCCTPAAAPRRAGWSTGRRLPSPRSTTPAWPFASTVAAKRSCRRASCKAPARTAPRTCPHAWARTVDGAQGGTWEACHLLGSSALDAYRGYTGQSRSRQPTHTWNTAKVAVVDHGGIARRPARPGRAGRRCPRPRARPPPGRPQRPLDPRPATARPDRRTRAGPRQPAC